MMGSRGQKEKEPFPFLHSGNGIKTQNDGPHLLVLYWRAGEIHVVKDVLTLSQVAEMAVKTGRGHFWFLE
jgi:hypothetical protein